MDLELSIIVAVYSETASVTETIERLLKKGRAYIKEIILVVSPRSSRACMDVCRQAAASFHQVRVLVQEHNPGQGWAFREGFDAAGGTHIAIMSADLETEPEAIDRMVCKVSETGCDVVSASRWRPKGGFEGYGRVKMGMNYLFQRLFMALFRTSVTDLTYGLKLYEAGLVKRIRWECTGHDLCLEGILKAIRLGARVEEVPTKWIRRAEGASKNNSAIVVLLKYLKIGFRIYGAPISALRRT